MTEERSSVCSSRPRSQSVSSARTQNQSGSFTACAKSGSAQRMTDLKEERYKAKTRKH